jgi:hypothetical protein
MHACMHACISEHASARTHTRADEHKEKRGKETLIIFYLMQLPFVLVRTSKDAEVVCLRSSDRTQVFIRLPHVPYVCNMNICI